MPVFAHLELDLTKSTPSKRQVRSALIGSGQAIKQQTFKALLNV